jgi:hypothetical protein
VSLLNKAVVAALLLLTMPMSAVVAETHAKDIPKHGKAEVLFDGKDLSRFDTFIKSTGLNSDPGHVFVVENGVIHVSGKEMGYIITKREYKTTTCAPSSNGARAPSLPAPDRPATAVSSTTSRAITKSGRVRSNFKSTKVAPAISG